jgi:hypothetical protein
VNDSLALPGLRHACGRGVPHLLSKSAQRPVSNRSNRPQRLNLVSYMQSERPESSSVVRGTAVVPSNPFFLSDLSPGPPIAYGPWNHSGQPFVYTEHVDEVSYGPSRAQLVEGSPKPLSLRRRVRWTRKVVSTTTRLEGTLRYIRTRLNLGPDSIRQGSRDINSLKVYLGPCERRRVYRRRSDTGRHLPTNEERYIVVYKR